MRALSIAAALSIGLGVATTSDAADAPVDLCPRATRQGWRSSPHGHVFPPWFFGAHTRMEVGAADGMKRLLDAFEAKGITPILVVIPPAPLVLPIVPPTDEKSRSAWSQDSANAAYSEWVGWLKQQGATVVSVRELARAMDPPEDFFLQLDHHWSPAGSRIVAGAVAEVIHAHPSWGSAPKRRFEVIEDGSTPLPFGGSAGKAIHTLCKTEHPDSAIPLFRSKALDPPSIGLLDDTPPMPVVVLGSSFSAPKFAFASFLREQVGAEVLPAHIDGGRLTASALNYFTSADFRERPPTWVVWELAIATEALADNGVTPFLGETKVFRQLVPAVTGDCEHPIREGTVPLSPGTNPLFSATPDTPIGAGHYLVFDSSEPLTGPLTVVTHYANDAEDRFEYGQHLRVKMPERYFMEFPLYRPEAVESVSLNAEEGASGELRYRVCAY